MMQKGYAGNPVITLTTDFGLYDEYVGTVKGMILRICRDAAIVDLTHNIEAQNIVAAAMSIGASFRFFPEGSVHMVVVDPGVGSDRRILAVKAAGHLFIAPDNGVLTPVLDEDTFQDAFNVINRDFFANTISPSFHGRDIMAPVAAHLACGMDISRLGPRLGKQQCCRIPLPTASHTDGKISGEVIHIDHFGNLRTSITAEDISKVPWRTGKRITIGSHTIDSISTTYTDQNAGQLIALLDSRDHLEIAITGGNAAKILGCRIGDRVKLTLRAE